MNKKFTDLIEGDLLSFKEVIKMSHEGDIGDPLVFVNRVDPYFDVADQIRTDILIHAVRDENPMLNAYGRIIDSAISQSILFWSVSYRASLLQLAKSTPDHAQIAVESVTSLMYYLRWFAMMAMEMIDLEDEGHDANITLALYHTVLSVWDGNTQEIDSIRAELNAAEKNGSFQIEVGGHTVYTQ